ncbi:MAG: hydrogenase nickel incorporation protein HypB [Prolixibacteraceae bacterium]|nr:hydrogenase nickel incorporation protein HypB [Prolixibacteraceae bacterium]
MCDTCGCGSTDAGYTISKPGENTHQHHSYGEVHGHTHEHNSQHHHHEHPHEKARTINIEQDVMQKNNLLASRNRGYLDAKNILALNLVSSPGSGKTTILEKTITALSDHQFFVIEGDQQTLNDANRINETGAKVVQVNTGSGCHLDAGMVYNAIKKLNPESGSILMIENVGNLVCPAMFDLGETKRVVIISVTEGDDKPMKYPYMFESSDLCIINKTDLLPYVDFDIEKCKSYALRLNPNLGFIELSAKTGEGMGRWFDWCVSQNK